MSQLKTNVQLSVFSELAGDLDVRKSYRTIAERIHRLDNMPIDYYPYVYIMLWNQDTNCLKVIGGAGKSEHFWKDVEVCSGKGVTGKAFFTQNIVNEGNVKLLPDDKYCCPEGHDDVHSELAIPITYKGQRLGVLDVQSPNKNEFGDDDKKFLKILADGIGVAMANSMQLDAKVGKALQVSNKVLEASEKNSRLRFWFSEVAKAGNEYIGADYLFLFRLSPGIRYPVKPVLSWPRITDSYYDNLWPIPDGSFFWKLIKKWEPVYGIEINAESKDVIADSWANRFVDSENISTIAFLPIGESYPLAALFVCYKEAKIFSDIDKLALKTFTNLLERSIIKIEVEPHKSTGKTIHNVLIPETMGVLGELENIENNAENKSKVLSYVEITRNRIMNLRKSVVLATVGVGDYEYTPKKQTLRSALVKLGAALNAGQNKRVVFDIIGTEEIENEDPIFNEVVYGLISEAMGNSVVHGKSRRVEINIIKTDKAIELSIIDDGVGLENEHSKSRPHGIYYWKKYLRSRFDIHLIINNQPTGGAKIFARFPVLPIS